MSKPVIEVKNLEKVYEGAVPVHAVNGISLTIAQGEFTALQRPVGMWENHAYSICLEGSTSQRPAPLLLEGWTLPR